MASKTERSRRRPVADEVTLLRAWCAWTTRGRKRYLRAILKLPPGERVKDRGASFGSIQNIFLHIIETYNWWFDNVPSGNQDGFEELVGREWSDDNLIRMSRHVDSVVRKLADSLKPSDLGRSYLVRGRGGDGRPYTKTVSLADMMWHMLEEESQHRGEINALFWQMDIDPPTDAWFGEELVKLSRSKTGPRTRN